MSDQAESRCVGEAGENETAFTTTISLKELEHAMHLTFFRSSPLTLDSLAEELILLIFEEFGGSDNGNVPADLKTLVNLSMVCKKFGRIVDPLLYRIVHLTLFEDPESKGMPSLEKHHRLAFCRPELYNHIRTLCILPCDFNPDFVEEDAALLDNNHWNMMILLLGDERLNETKYHHINEEVVTGVWDLSPSSTSKLLRRTWRNHGKFLHTFTRLVYKFSVFTNLQRLELPLTGGLLDDLHLVFRFQNLKTLIFRSGSLDGSDLEVEPPIPVSARTRGHLTFTKSGLKHLAFYNVDFCTCAALERLQLIVHACPSIESFICNSPKCFTFPQERYKFRCLFKLFTHRAITGDLKRMELYTHSSHYVSNEEGDPNQVLFDTIFKFRHHAKLEELRLDALLLAEPPRPAANEPKPWPRVASWNVDASAPIRLDYLLPQTLKVLHLRFAVDALMFRMFKRDKLVETCGLMLKALLKRICLGKFPELREVGIHCRNLREEDEEFRSWREQYAEKAIQLRVFALSDSPAAQALHLMEIP